MPRWRAAACSFTSTPANSARTPVVSQVGAAALSYGLPAWLGPGYLSAALALVGIIGLMLLTDTMHPPAVATAFNYALRVGRGAGSLALFGVAVGLVLLAVRCGPAYLLRRFTTVL